MMVKSTLQITKSPTPAPALATPLPSTVQVLKEAHNGLKQQARQEHVPINFATRIDEELDSIRRYNQQLNLRFKAQLSDMR